MKRKEAFVCACTCCVCVCFVLSAVVRFVISLIARVICCRAFLGASGVGHKQLCPLLAWLWTFSGSMTPESSEQETHASAAVLWMVVSGLFIFPHPYSMSPLSMPLCPTLSLSSFIFLSLSLAFSLNMPLSLSLLPPSIPVSGLWFTSLPVPVSLSPPLCP